MELEKMLEALSSDIMGFIQSKKISPEGVSRYRAAIDLADKERKQWALNNRLSPLDSLVVFGSYNAIYKALLGIETALDIGIRTHDNPKSAERVQPVVENLVELAHMLDALEAEVKERKPSAATIDSIRGELDRVYDSGRMARVLPTLHEEIKQVETTELERLGATLYESASINTG